MTVYKNFKNPSQMTEKEQQELGGKAVGAVITLASTSTRSISIIIIQKL